MDFSRPEFPVQIAHRRFIIQFRTEPMFGTTGGEKVNSAKRAMSGLLHLGGVPTEDGGGQGDRSRQVGPISRGRVADGPLMPRSGGNFGNQECQ